MAKRNTSDANTNRPQRPFFSFAGAMPMIILALVLLGVCGGVLFLRATGRRLAILPAATVAPPPPATPTATAKPAATPLPTNTPVPPTATPPPATATATPAPHVMVGATVMVSDTGGLDLRLRAGPGLDFVTLKIVQEGAQLLVLEGPQTADDHTWWRMREAQGVVGWAVEDWLVPVSPKLLEPVPSPTTTVMPVP